MIPYNYHDCKDHVILLLIFQRAYCMFTDMVYYCMLKVVCVATITVRVDALLFIFLAQQQPCQSCMHGFPFIKKTLMSGITTHTSLVS